MKCPNCNWESEIGEGTPTPLAIAAEHAASTLLMGLAYAGINKQHYHDWCGHAAMVVDELRAAGVKINESDENAIPDPTCHQVNSQTATVLDPPMFGDIEKVMRRRGERLGLKHGGHYYVAAADAIRDLRVALASQIEISNDLRRQSDPRPAIDSQTLTCKDCGGDFTPEFPDERPKACKRCNEAQSGEPL